MKGREIEPSVLFRWDTGGRGDEATDFATTRISLARE